MDPFFGFSDSKKLYYSRIEPIFYATTFIKLNAETSLE